MDSTEFYKTVINWKGDFESLAKQFERNDYYEIVYNEEWFYIDIESVEELYNDDYYKDVLYLFIADSIMNNISYGGKGNETDNLYRLWNEYND